MLAKVDVGGELRPTLNKATLMLHTLAEAHTLERHFATHGTAKCCDKLAGQATVFRCKGLNKPVKAEQPPATPSPDAAPYVRAPPRCLCLMPRSASSPWEWRGSWLPNPTDSTWPPPSFTSWPGIPEGTEGA